jgi:hypothetical protein
MGRLQQLIREAAEKNKKTRTVSHLTPENNERVISNFFENSRRYLQVEVHHQYQQHWR